MHAHVHAYRTHARTHVRLHARTHARTHACTHARTSGAAATLCSCAPCRPARLSHRQMSRHHRPPLSQHQYVRARAMLAQAHAHARGAHTCTRARTQAGGDGGAVGGSDARSQKKGEHRRAFVPRPLAVWYLPKGWMHATANPCGTYGDIDG